MIRNAFLKNLLMGTVFKTISGINKIVKKNDNKILLYSDLGFRDNIKYLYDYLVEQNFQKKYKIICAVKDYQKYAANSPKNIEFVSPLMGIKHYLTCNHVFYCFGKLPIVPVKKQVVIQMWHGTSFKGFAENMTKTSSNADSFYSYVYASSDFFSPIVMKKFNCSENKVAICGHPRTDVFYLNEKKYDLGNYKKTIVWMPTFRKSKILGQVDTKQSSILPTVMDSQLLELDKFLEGLNTQLIVKLHPMQDLSEVDTKSLNNLKLLSNKQFEDSGMDIYRLLSQSDALITDYSSVFYDYLLLNRPIGFTENDVDEYKKNRGFAVDPEKFRPGKRIRSLQDLESFIIDLSNNKDDYLGERKWVNDMANKYQDGKNCSRSLKLSHIHL